MPSRTDILAKIPNAPPIAVKESEAAALCAMTRARFTSLCPLKPAAVGRDLLYRYDDVAKWFQDWYCESTSGKNDNSSWVDRFK